MYSPRVEQEITSQRPEDLIISNEEVIHIAREKGLMVNGDKITAFGKRSLFSLRRPSQTIQLPLRITWNFFREDSFSGWFPFFKPRDHDYSSEAPDPLDIIQEELRLPESKAVSFSEPLVTLPLPPWVTFLEVIYNEPLLTTYLLSEAKELWQQYKEEVRKSFLPEQIN